MWQMMGSAGFDETDVENRERIWELSKVNTHHCFVMVRWVQSRAKPNTVDD